MPAAVRQAHARQPRRLALWRVDGDRAEIVTVSMWESRSMIEGFAGQDIDQAVFYPEDDPVPDRARPDRLPHTKSPAGVADRTPPAACYPIWLAWPAQ